MILDTRNFETIRKSLEMTHLCPGGTNYLCYACYQYRPETCFGQKTIKKGRREGVVCKTCWKERVRPRGNGIERLPLFA